MRCQDETNCGTVAACQDHAGSIHSLCSGRKRPQPRPPPSIRCDGVRPCCCLGFLGHSRTNRRNSRREPCNRGAPSSRVSQRENGVGKGLSHLGWPSLFAAHAGGRTGVPEPWLVQARAGAVVVVSPIRAALAQRLQQPVKPSVVYRLLARHGWRKVAPDTRYPRASPRCRRTGKNSPKCWKPC